MPTENWAAVMLKTRPFSWKVDIVDMQVSSQQLQYGSCPSATLKVNEKHLSSLNNKLKPALEDWPALGPVVLVRCQLLMYVTTNLKQLC